MRKYAFWACADSEDPDQTAQHAQTAKTQIRLRRGAVWSGPSQSAVRIIGNYCMYMYHWRAKARMRPCACAGCCESAHFAHARRHFFAWRVLELYKQSRKQRIVSESVNSKPFQTKRCFRAHVDSWGPDQPMYRRSLLSTGTAFSTIMHVRPAKTHISLCIPRSLIRIFAVHLRTLWLLDYPQSALRRLWSDCADVQADLSLHWKHIQSFRKCCVQAYSFFGCCRIYPRAHDVYT